MNNLKSKTCCFTGHRKIPSWEYDNIINRMEYEIKMLIKKGIVYFGTGGALGFDTMAALTVLKLKKEYPQIKLILVLPCENQTKGWNQKSIEIYESIKEQADKVTYISKEYTKGCMHKRNRHLIDNSSYCICFFNKSCGGTAHTVYYAQKNGLQIINCSK